MRSVQSMLLVSMLSCAIAAGCSNEPNRTGGGNGGGDFVGGGEGPSDGEGVAGTPGGDEAEGEAEGEGENGEGPGPDPEPEPQEGCDDRCHCAPPLICDPEIPPSGECVASAARCNGNADCPCRSVCKRGSCEDGCFNNDDCGRGNVCRQVAENKDACFQKCADGFECPKGPNDEELFHCIDEACIPKVEQCAECDDDSQCGGPADRCIDFGDTGRFCTQDCDLDPNSCPDGFRCVELEREEDDGRFVQLRQCVPQVGDCKSVCTFIGCDDPDKPHCNPISGKCKASFAACDPCRSQAQCGELTCLEYPREDQFHCLPPCPRGQSDCPDSGWRCEQGGTRPWCVPLNASCNRCLGKNCGKLNPHCDPTNGQCVECLADLDCPEGQHCGIDTHQCIQSRRPCNPNGVGEAEELCLADEPFCFDQWCVTCVSNRDCNAGCVPDAEDQCNLVCHNFTCLGDNFCQAVDCPEGTLCVNAARQCVEGGRCESDRECGDSRLCDQQRNECYNNDATCAHNGDCPQGLVCDLNQLLCKGCRDNSQCRRRQHCVPARDGSDDRVCIQS